MATSSFVSLLLLQLSNSFLRIIIIIIIIIIIRTSFALLRSALVCLRGSRVKRRAAFDYNNCDIEIAAAEGAIDIV